MINISEEYTSWTNRLKVETGKEIENQSEWVYDGERVKWSAIQASQWRVSVVREQASAGTLEGFHLKENVKYSLKQFNKANNHKEPDLTPHGKANINWCHSLTSYSGAPTSSYTVSGILKTLQEACEVQLATRERVAWVDAALFSKISDKSTVKMQVIWRLNVTDSRKMPVTAKASNYDLLLKVLWWKLGFNLKVWSVWWSDWQIFTWAKFVFSFLFFMFSVVAQPTNHLLQHDIKLSKAQSKFLLFRNVTVWVLPFLWGSQISSKHVQTLWKIAGL